MGLPSSNSLKRKALEDLGTANEPIYVTDEEDANTGPIKPKPKILPLLPERRKLQDLGLSNIVQDLPFHWKQWIAQEKEKIKLDGKLIKDIALPVWDRITLEGKELKKLLNIPDSNSDKSRQGWLNDEVINGFMGLLHNQMNPDTAPQRVPRFIFQSSFTWLIIRNAFGPLRDDNGEIVKNANGNLVLPKVQDMPGNTKRTLEKNLSNNNIQRGKDIFSVEAILFPMCRKGHWVLGVLRPRRLTLELYDSYAKVNAVTSEVIPWTNGSAMNWSDHFIISVVSWLRWVGNNEGPRIDLKSMKIQLDPGPQQSTLNDCGVYVCTTAQCLARNIEPEYDLQGVEEDENASLRKRQKAAQNASQTTRKNPEKETTSMRQREYIAAVLKQCQFGGELPWEPPRQL